MGQKFREYKGLDLVNVADEILRFWDDNDIFEKSISTRKGNTPFVFFEGPPSANGLPGIHHVMSRAIKDIFCRSIVTDHCVVDMDSPFGFTGGA